MKKIGFALVVLLSLCAVVAHAAQKTVTVRAGVHARYNRLVFDWTDKVTYTLRQGGGSVTIQFNIPATADLKNVAYTNPPYIKNLKQETTKDGLRITFDIPTDSRVQAFWSDKKVAFDVLRMDKKPPVFKTQGATAQPSNATPPPKQETSAPPVKPAPAEPDVTTGPQKIDVTPVPANLNAPQKPEQAGLQTLADIITGKQKQADKKAKLDAPQNAVPKGGTSITLTPSKLTRLAVFERVGRLWVVLDSPERDLLPKVEGEWNKELQRVTRISLDKAVAFVFDLPGDITSVPMAIRRNGMEWSVHINPQNGPRVPGEMPIRVVDGDGPTDQPTVTLYAGEQPQVLMFKDTKMGDRLWVVPVRSPEGRIVQPRKTPGYYLLPTFIGGVIAPRHDHLRVGTVNDLVVLSPAAGHKMLLSELDDRKKGVIRGAATPAFRLDVPLGELKNRRFMVQRQELEKKIVAEKSPSAKATQHMNLARLYLAQGFAAEAAGLLRIAVRLEPSLEVKQDYRALRGMAAALMGDEKAAIADLKADDLYSQPLAQLWLGYAYARDSQFGLAREAFAESGSSDESLPPALQPRVFLARAEAALDGGDMAAAEFELKKITDPAKISPSEKAAYNYIRASILLVTENKPDGMDLYRELATGPDQKYRAKATLDLTAQKLQDKEIDLNRAIETLEGLRFSWRGDRLEVKILQDLGKYYVENKDYMNGLTTLRMAAGLSKNSDDTDQITEDMQNVFRDLYVNGKAKEMEPLKALAVFERFRELTPPGEEGRTARLALAERLVSVDLLDQADALMENQMLKNSSGEQAVKLGLKLANLRLLNRNPSGALKALDESEQAAEGMTGDIMKRRILLRARALADVGRVEEALALLGDDQFPEGLSLKADINWRQARWSQAVLTLQKLLTRYRDEGKGAPDGPMPPLILKMAIALALDDNVRGIELLAAEYGPFMKKTAQSEAFDLITRPSRGSALADLQTLKKQVGEVELFEEFLKKFNS